MNGLAEASHSIVRRCVRTDGRLVSYLTVECPGQGEILLLIHGSGVSGRYWSEQLLGLSTGLQVLALDLPGHGESDPIRETSVEAYADAVAGFLARLGADRVFVAGHSLGGAVALALAARRPRMVSGLMLISSCATLPRTGSWAEHLLSYVPGPLRKVLFFMTAKKMLFAPGASEFAVRLGMQELVACRPETILRDVETARTMDLTELARGLETPTLVVCGTRDRVTPPVLSHQLHAMIRGSRMTMVEGAGHTLLLEAPKRINEEIAAFIATVAGQRESARPWSGAAARMRAGLERFLARAGALRRWCSTTLARALWLLAARSGPRR